MIMMVTNNYVCRQTKTSLPPLPIQKWGLQSLQIHRLVVLLCQRCLSCPAVAPEDICGCRDGCLSVGQGGRVCFKVLIPVTVGARVSRRPLRLKGAVALDKKELGFTRQPWTGIGIKEVPDCIQVQPWAPWLCAQQVTFRAPTDDTAGKCLCTAMVTELSNLPQGGQAVCPTQQLPQDHVEMETFECLFKPVCVNNKHSNQP